MKIYYKSDFEIIEQFFDAKGEAINISDLDIEIIYTTSGWEKYEVSRIAGVEKNCFYNIDDTSKLTIIFDEHQLQAGVLNREIKINSKNLLFEGGIQEIIVKSLTDINLVTQGGEQCKVECETVLPAINSTETLYIEADVQGLQDGLNQLYTIFPDYRTNSTIIYLSGLFMRRGYDYVEIENNKIQFLSDVIPERNENLVVKVIPKIF